MLTKPDVADELIISRLQDEYDLHVRSLTFLPLGADMGTAAYRLVADDGTAYFLKLRKGFEEIGVTIPLFLKSQGIQEIIAPFQTRSKQGWAEFGEYKMILYPFIEGKDAYEAALSDEQWLEFGTTLRGVHAMQLPPQLRGRLQLETFSPKWRERLGKFQKQMENTAFDDPIAARLAAFMCERCSDITRVLDRADKLGLLLASRNLEFVLCHSDVHPGNLLITSSDSFYLVDWDQPVLALKERDLVLIGGSAFWNDPQKLELFYQSYGRHADTSALAYYRYERVIQDLGVECELILSASAGAEDREREYEYFVSNFLPGREIELARIVDHEIR